MKKVHFYGISLFVFFIISFTYYGCNSDSTPVQSGVTYDANTINGTITFVDSAFISDTLVGYYSINAYSSWPPTGAPSAIAKIVPAKSTSGKYTANYKLVFSGDGSFTLTTAFIKLPYTQGSVFGLGMYDNTPGNDTTHNAGIIYGPHTKAVISGGAGIGNINYNSWIDTTKKIYNF